MIYLYRTDNLSTYLALYLSEWIFYLAMEMTSKMTSRDILLIFGSRIREYRIRLKMTQRELAEKSGLSVLTIHRFENGSSQNISLSVFILLVKSLGMVDRLDNLLPELPPSPYEFNEKGKRVQRIRHKKNWNEVNLSNTQRVFHSFFFYSPWLQQQKSRWSLILIFHNPIFIAFVLDIC